MPAMSTKSREVIWGGRILGANMSAKSAREAAQKAIPEADRAEAELVGPSGVSSLGALVFPRPGA